MSRIWSMMDIGRRSMANSQTALQTVSHNVANKSTEGYSRQRVEVQTSPATGLGRQRVGTGATTTGVVRINNEYLEKQIQGESTKLGYSEAEAESMARVEQVFNEQVNKGLNKFMGEFFNAFRELANAPESLAARTLVKESADFLTKDFQRVHNQLTSIQGDIDFQVTAVVSEINAMAREVADLNHKVQVVELQGAAANDERDRRDLLLKKMGELVNIKWAEGDSGLVTVSVGNAGVIVSGHESRDLTVAGTVAKNGKREGNVEIFYEMSKGTEPINITPQIRGGKLGGLLAVRDNKINGLLNQVDEVAYTLAHEVNRAHQMGFTRYNQKGQVFFKLPNSARDAAAEIEVNNSILSDVGQIAAAAQPFAPGDNRVANVISSLQYKEAMRGGTTTLDGFYNSLVGQTGIEANRANNAARSQSDIVKQLGNIRESISGVSLDEETTKMIEFQKSFDASARLIRTADEMMDTVLNLKR